MPTIASTLSMSWSTGRLTGQRRNTPAAEAFFIPCRGPSHTWRPRSWQRRRPIPRPSFAPRTEDHRAVVYAFLISTTRDGELAAELLQEAYIRLLKAARGGARPLDTRSWLYRVAGNLAVSAGRRRQTMCRVAPWLARRDDAESPEAEYLRREDARRVHGELARLRPDDRVALLLAAHGCSTQEIAQSLNRSELATRSLLCRARVRLRDRMTLEEADR